MCEKEELEIVQKTKKWLKQDKINVTDEQAQMLYKYFRLLAEMIVDDFLEEPKI